MITQEDIDAFKEEKHEAQLHQFAAAALTGLVSGGVGSFNTPCSKAWDYAVEIMRIKPGFDK